MTLPLTLQSHVARVNTALTRFLPAPTTPLTQAMNYGVINGGKRIRPLLVYGVGLALGAEPSVLDAPACAVELIHAYSLIHDDLPAMDNSDLRRNHPTCHKVFGDALAILAGNSLQTLAFEILCEPSSHGLAALQLEMITVLAKSCGHEGIAQGQAIDLAATVQNIDELQNMHLLKTGALIRASVLLGALSVSNTTQNQCQIWSRFANCLGLAFQIQDDILDVEGNPDLLGKPQGSDNAQGKITYPALMGLDKAKQHALALQQEAQQILEDFGVTHPLLQELTDFLIKRTW